MFHPFDLGKWFVLGWTAWLASLLEFRSSGGSGSGGVQQSPEGGELEGGGAEAAGDEWQELVEWLAAHREMVLWGGGALVLLGAVVWVALLWVQSRAKFMFLDNVVHNRALVAEPWRRFKREGNALFRWSLLFSVSFGGFFVLMAGGAAYWAYGVYLQGGGWTTEAGWLLAIVGLVLLVGLLFYGFITLLLEDFVVPLMYRHGLACGAAWKRLLEVLRSRVGSFVLFACWKILLSLASGVAVVVFGLMTCCIGFIPMMIPYLGTVLLLPLFVFFRCLGPGFLRQLGDDYDLFVVESWRVPPELPPE